MDQNKINKYCVIVTHDVTKQKHVVIDYNVFNKVAQAAASYRELLEGHMNGTLAIPIERSSVLAQADETLREIGVIK